MSLHNHGTSTFYIVLLRSFAINLWLVGMQSRACGDCVPIGMGLQEKGYGEGGRDPEYRVTQGLRKRLAQPTIELMTLAPASVVKQVARMDRSTLDRLLDEPPPCKAQSGRL